MDILKTNLRVLGKYVICLLLCFFTVLSFTAVFTMMTPPEIIGEYKVVYKETEKEEDIKVEYEYEHLYANGEDTKQAEYEAQGYKVEIAKKLTGPLTGAYKVVSQSLAQIVCLFFFIIIVPHELYKRGLEDRNKVSCGRMAEDKLFGLKSGFAVAAVNLITFGTLILARLGLFKAGFALYRFANYHLYGYQQLIMGDPKDYTEIPAWGIALAVLPAALTLLVCWITYLLGYKDINPAEKLVYKKK